MRNPRNATAAGQSAVTAAAFIFVVALLLASCAGSGGGSVRGAPPTFAPLVEQVLPAVVNVAAVEYPARAAADREAMPLDPTLAAIGGAAHSSAALARALRRLLEAQRKEEAALPDLAVGSGFLIDPRGYIVTDDHVIEDAASIPVTLYDGSRHRARIIGRDSPTDLALIAIETPRPLPYLRWGDSDGIRIGDWVLAVGNPFGLDDTVSSGIVSARGRDIHSGPYDDFLQIDAALNRGNSGGPTFDLDGRVIGINTAIYSPTGGSIGIGFAIPANLARPVVEQLAAHGRVERGWLGVAIRPPGSDTPRGARLMQGSGALVARVGADSPAARAGFERDDVTLSVNGLEIAKMRDLPLAVAALPIGRPAEIQILRGHRTIGLHPVIGEMPVRTLPQFPSRLTPSNAATL